MKLEKISRGRYRLGDYDIIRSGWRIWSVWWGISHQIKSGVEMSKHPTRRAALAEIAEINQL